MEQTEMATDATLRDFFAAAALQGFLASRRFDVPAAGQKSQCEQAYQYADYMLQARYSSVKGDE